MNRIKNNESGFSVVEIVMVIVIVGLIGAVGYLVYKNQHKTIATSTSKPVASTTAKTNTASKQPTDTTAGWSTYTSAASNGNFNFKYPSSGWTMVGSRNPGVTTVDASSLDGSEYTLELKENKGQGLSTNGNDYTITIGIQSKQGIGAYYNYGQGVYPEGTVSSLSNGLQIWQETNNGGLTTDCSNAPQLFLVSNDNFYKQLSTGNYLAFNGTFCFGYKATTTLTYQQQVNSTEATIAKQILSTFTFK